MRFTICIIVGMMLCSTVFGADPNSVAPSGRSWLLEFAGSDNVLKVGAFWSPTPRVEVGPEFGYWDGLKTNLHQEWSFEVVARYFALEKKDWDLKVLKVDAMVYVGLGLGLEVSRHNPVDDIADVRTGLVFGEGPIALGVEYSYVLSDLMWGGTANGDHRVFGTISYRFGGK